MPVVKTRSVMTGRFWPCQSAGFPNVHPRGPVAVPIQVGKANQAFYRCSCRDNHFFTPHPSVDPHSVGYTAEEIVRMGYFIA